MGGGRALGLLLGVAADAVFGDPRRFHPVAAFGRSASALEKRLYADSKAAGVAYTAVLVGSTVAAGVVVERAARRHWLAQALTTGLATWTVLGGSSLAAEGTSMGRELDSGDIEAARARLPHLCGRDASRLDTFGLARATVESVAENTSDAVVAPLVWGSVFGVPGLLGYRAANTLDAMVGHRSPRYSRFGWASARLDDLLNLLPSRLAAAAHRRRRTRRRRLGPAGLGNVAPRRLGPPVTQRGPGRSSLRRRTGGPPRRPDRLLARRRGTPRARPWPQPRLRSRDACRGAVPGRRFRRRPRQRRRRRLPQVARRSTSSGFFGRSSSAPPGLDSRIVKYSQPPTAMTPNAIHCNA